MKLEDVRVLYLNPSSRFYGRKRVEVRFIQELLDDGYAFEDIEWIQQTGTLPDKS